MEQAKILVINDGSSLFYGMAGLLESKGFRTKVTETAAEALGTLSACLFDLVIMKLHSGQTDRVALLPKIKELCPKAKLIIMSDQAALPVEAYEVAVDDFIIMTCSSAQLWRQIFSCLESITYKPLISPPEERLNPVNRQALNRLGIMFHDIRGSMVAITAGLKLLMRRSKGSLGEDSDKLLEVTFNKAKTLISMTEDFFNSYFSSGAYAEIEPEYLDIRMDIVDPILDELGDEILKNQITVINRLDFLPAHLGSVQGDRVALKTAFRNLFSNAVKHGGKGGTIRIDMEQQDSGWRLQISNDGPSIPKKRRATLFSKPTLSAHKNNGKEKGLGLGLYLSREIIKSCGGDILYQPGQDGSNFILTFPGG
jgi:signal transduction histidine kinase